MAGGRNRGGLGAARFAPDGRLVVMASDADMRDGRRENWDDVQGKGPEVVDLNKAFGAEGKQMRLRAVSPDGRTVVVYDARGGAASPGAAAAQVYLTLHDVKSGETVRKFGPFEAEPLAGGQETGAEVAEFSPDGRLLAVAGGGAVSLFDVKTGRPVAPRGGAKVTALAVSPDGRALAVGGSDGALALRPTGPAAGPAGAGAGAGAGGATPKALEAGGRARGGGPGGRLRQGREDGAVVRPRPGVEVLGGRGTGEGEGGPDRPTRVAARCPPGARPRRGVAGRSPRGGVLRRPGRRLGRRDREVEVPVQRAGLHPYSEGHVEAIRFAADGSLSVFGGRSQWWDAAISQSRPAPRSTIDGSFARTIATSGRLCAAPG